MTTLLPVPTDEATRQGDPVAEIEDLRISVGGPEGRHVVVDGVSLRVRAGETVGLVGESGSGKTMTALGLAGLLPRGAAVEAGRVSLSGTDLGTLTERGRARVRAERIGVVFQNPTASLNPRLTIATQLLEALPRDAGSRGRRRARAADLLGRVGVADVGKTLGAFPHELSGGLNQRVVIAMALARDPALLVADEPTTALDVSVQAQVVDLIDGLKHELGLGVLLVSHDIGVIGDRADTVHVMSAGTIVESGPTARVLRAPRHDYTRELLAATPALLRRADTAPTGATPVGGEVLATGRPSTDERPEFAVAPPHQGHPAAQHREHPATPVVRVREVRRAFPVAVPGRVRKQRHVALHGVSLDIASGAAIGVVGESGSGKTTLARQIVGLDSPDSGVVEYEGRPLDTLDRRAARQWRRAVQYVFQDPYGALDPRLTVERSIAEPLELNGVDTGGRGVAQRVRELLGEVELPASYAGRLPRELSGGQRQRVVIARALANDPRVVVADEPVSALDLSVQARILRLLERLRRERGLTLVLISHDLAVVRFLCDHVVVMERGRIVESGATEQIYTAPAHPYTRSLLAAVPGASIPAYHEETS